MQIDVSKLIEILQATIEFENDLQYKFDQNKIDELDDFEPKAKIDADGNLQIETGSVAEIKAKYQNSKADD